MQSKVLGAFLAGAAIAGAIVYVVIRPAPIVKSNPKPIFVSSAMKSPDPPEVPEAASEPAAEPTMTAPKTEEAPPETPHAPPHPPAAKRTEKPSPMPRHPKEADKVARVTFPPQSARPADKPQAPETAPPPEPQPAPQAPAAAPPAAAPPAAPPAPEPTAPPVQAPPAPEPPHAEQPLQQPHTVTLTAGLTIPVRIGETLTSERAQPGDTFLATLDQPLVVEGFVIAERGSRVQGRVVEAERAARGRSNSRLVIELVKLATADGQNVPIRTDTWAKDGQAQAGMDAARIGAGAAIGAAIGAAAGGGKGAAIGAGVGGAAGVGDVLLTRGRDTVIRVETRIRFRLEAPITLTERLN